MLIAYLLIIASGIYLSQVKSLQDLPNAYLVYSMAKLALIKNTSDRKSEIVFKTAQYCIFGFIFFQLALPDIQHFLFPERGSAKTSEFLLTLGICLNLALMPFLNGFVDYLDANKRFQALPLFFFELGIFLNLIIEFFSLQILSSLARSMILFYCPLTLLLTVSLAELQYSFHRKMAYLFSSIGILLTWALVSHIS